MFYALQTKDYIKDVLTHKSQGYNTCDSPMVATEAINSWASLQPIPKAWKSPKPQSQIQQ